MKIVLVGGGTGISCIGRHFAAWHKKNSRKISKLTLIQHPYDTGGNSGLIMKQYGIRFGFGDFRNSIIGLGQGLRMPIPVIRALSSRGDKKYTLNQADCTSLDNVSVGNAIMARVMLESLDKPGQGLTDAIQVLSYMCHLPRTFQVLPVSLDPAVLVAHLEDGTVLRGESAITKHNDTGSNLITKVVLEPHEGLSYPQLYEKARTAVISADLVVMCPGSFRTSLEPHILVKGFVDAIQTTKAQICMIVNIATIKPSETANWNTARFVEQMSERLLGRIHCTFTNNSEQEVPKAILEKGWQLIPSGSIPGFEPRCDIRGNFADFSSGTPRHNAAVVEAIMNQV